MWITSPAFADHGSIPQRHTCQGEDVSPPLTWADVPPEAKSLVLILEDPDAPDPAKPKRVFVHWLVYDLPPTTSGLTAAVTLPTEAKTGRNDYDTTRYRGPCPPIGRHRYFFRLFALDTVLPDLRSPTRGELGRAMEGHVIATAELVGTYQKE